MHQEKAMHCKEKKRSKALVWFLTVDVCICICILLAAWAIFLKEPQAVALAPDVAPAEVEPNQTPLIEEGTDGESAASSSDNTEDGGSKVSLRFSNQVKISLTNKTATLVVGSGERSLVDLVAQIVVQDHVLAQTGKVTPGNQVEKLNLAEGAAELLSEGIYEGQFMFYYYSRTTGEQITVASSIPITVTVEK